ncbi:MAG: amino acid deaminase [Acidobacteriota bacterium]
MQRLSDSVGILNKGLGYFEGAVDAEQLARRNWNLLREDISLPAAVLYRDRLQHNLNWMRGFIAAYRLRLAPHGKTTMAPRLFEMQIESGAWGITLATAQQTRVAWAHGVRRVLMANQLIGKENMAIVARLLEDPGFEFYCLVDSAAQVDQLGAYFSKRGRRLQVLLEVGVHGGRTGVRNEEQLRLVLESLARNREAIALCGVEMYEGVLDDERAIREFLRRAASITTQLKSEGRFECAPAILSGAGSSWYDVVAEEFAQAGFGEDIELILRPGCYLTHDVGAYRRAQTRILEQNPVARKMHEGLQPALQVWAYVQSIPEPEKAIVGLGKRDAAFDSGLPVPALHFRPGASAPQSAPSHWVMTKMMDQHAYLQIGGRDHICVGDMIGFDICHPCLTFDKWRTLCIVDAEYQVVEVVQTFF